MTEKSTTELKDELNQLSKRANEITSAAKTEKRMPTEAENNEINEIVARMSEIRVAIAHNEAVAAQLGGAGGGKPAGEPYSLRKAIVSHLSSAPGSPLIVPVEARAAVSATGAAGTGSDLIDTQFMDILPALRDRIVLIQAGAQMLTGLKDNLDIPEYSGGNTNWAAENAAAADGAGTFSHKKMSPKRLTSYIDISRQFLLQDTLGSEAVLRNDLISTIAINVQKAALDGHAASANIPNSIFTGFADPAVALDWDAIIDLETQVDVDNALQGNVSYIMATQLYGAAKGIVKDASGAGGFILDAAGTMNGYQARRSNSVVGDATNGYGIAFGNWADLLIGQWGGIELIIDPYTQATEAMIRITVNSYWDILLRRNASIAMAKMTVGA